LDQNRIPALKWLLTFAVILGAGTLGFALPRLGSRLPLLILPSGFAIAAMYRWGRRMWPAVFAAGVAIDLSTHQPLVASIGVGVGLASGAALTAWALERRGFDASFSRAKDVPLFIICSALGMTLTPAFGFLGFFLAGVTIEAVHPVNWLRWWSNNTAGALLVTPALMAVSRRSFLQFIEHRVQGALWLLAVAACCAAILLARDNTTTPLIVVFAVLLIVVAALRFGLAVSASGVFAISTLTAYSFAFSRGAFGQLYELQGLVITWTFVAALAGVNLMVTALLAERDSASRELLRSEQRYAQIFNGSPQPIWVHDRKSLKILMINDAAVRQYGWSREEILSMSVAALIPPDVAHAASYIDESSETLHMDPFETRHLTRDGRVLEVEVWTRSIDFMGHAAELVFAVDVTERRAFGRALVEAIAGEQRRIGQEMHDGLGQELTGLALSLRALANRAVRERDAIAEDLDQLASLATTCIQNAQLIVQGLSPLTDADGSLEGALEALARRSSLSGTTVRFHAQHAATLNLDLKARNHLYRIAQEAVQNALKHSAAKAVAIELSVRDGSVRLAISDDGRGLPAEEPRGTGLGMRTMRFRAGAIGGRLSLRRRTDGGYEVACEAPQTRGGLTVRDARA
jgi:PAS domain S-box-containing protein